jgi:hypothetical protein
MRRVHTHTNNTVSSQNIRTYENITRQHLIRHSVLFQDVEIDRSTSSDSAQQEAEDSAAS